MHGDETPLGIEASIQRVVGRHVDVPEDWKPAFSPGIPVGVIAVVLALALWSLARRWWRLGAACAAVPLAMVVAEVLLKPLVGRVTTGGDYMYPSGHLTGIGAAATLVLVAVGPRLTRSWAMLGLGVAVFLACAAGVLVALASFSHGPADTVAGLPTGAAVALAWVLVVDTVSDAAAGWMRPRANAGA